ncbi:MAG: CooT family nickel-binding protein [Thermoplasmata archaeon]|nr:MAG: CooT family nickel-binding protein [Thermoplasmata archaeon]
MCESTVFIDEKGELKEIMENVTRIDVYNNKAICLGLLGEREEIEGVQIIEANLMEHKIVLGKVK